jgi:hypothetical protein
MPDEFAVERSSEFGINIRHCEERHLYLFGIGKDEAGARGFTTSSLRAVKKAKHPAEDFQDAAREFAEKAARELGLLDDDPRIPIRPGRLTPPT